ncbi:MAG: diguanylate cyclase [bacterium]|nr:diguanylate cyclase [bacterium]
MNDSNNDKSGISLRKISNLFLNLNIAKKMLIGYLPLSALTILTAAYTLSVLYSLNDISESIIRTDIRLIERSEQMLDHILAQERYGKRYIILKTPEMKGLFLKRSEEFKKGLLQFNELSTALGFKKTAIAELNETYNKLYAMVFESKDGNSDDSPKQQEQIEEQIRNIQGEIVDIIKDINTRARRDLDEKAMITSQMGAKAFSVVFLLCVLSILFGIGAAMFITHYMSSAIGKLKVAIKHISEGSFEAVPLLESRDEIGELTSAFADMSTELQRLKKLDLDASPLTFLPGNTAIENLLEKKIAQGEYFSFCYLDLDNFKAFNDRYGYARGSEVIKATADVVEQSVRSLKHDGDFVGHIGGDDFVVITASEDHDELCKTIIKDFDKIIVGYYDAEDIKRGYIEGKTRQGEKRDFPIMTISIAVVTSRHRTIVSHIQVGEIAADLKAYAKSIPGSAYVVDKRTDHRLDK